MQHPFCPYNEQANYDQKVGVLLEDQDEVLEADEQGQEQELELEQQEQEQEEPEEQEGHEFVAKVE